MNAQPAPSAKSNVAIKIIGLCLMISGGCGVCLFVEGVKRQILKAIEDSRKE